MPEQDTIQLSLIIVNYNVRYFLEQALQSVFRSTGGLTMEVFVVDNQSVDDSVAMIRSQFPQVRLCVNNENVGFSRANNQAIRQARGQYVLLLNPDTVLEEDTLIKSYQFMEAHPEAGALGVRMIDGAGKFLPESKRGFPSPWAAFCKASGLSRLFPRSKWFGTYHLGYLSEKDIHKVDVLSGAFMFIRKSVLDQVGLLDETFFMYGEDIDLSYRIRQGGYQNYYFPDTTIIHYKGESTKKGSLNYIRAFYQAMIIFARKHFREGKASRLIALLQVGIYLQAFLALSRRFFHKAAFPLLDTAGFYLGLVLLKDFWSNYHFNDPDYFKASILYTNFPWYVGIWVGGIYLSGGYDKGGGLRRVVRGVFLGTLVLAAIYGLLDLELRSSRALVVIGSAWALIYAVAIRYGIHFLRYRNFRLGSDEQENLVIIGSEAESKRVRQLLQEASVQKNFIGTVSPNGILETDSYLSSLDQLEEVVHIFRVQEVIFCSNDVPSTTVIEWMTRLGPTVHYKMVPKESLSVIGSSDKNTSGELYTIDIEFRIDQPMQRRNKRLLDIAFSLLFFLALPIHLFTLKSVGTGLRNAFQVLFGRKSWVGYVPTPTSHAKLPVLKKGVLHPGDIMQDHNLRPASVDRINFYYAKDYRPERDLEILIKGYPSLGRAGGEA
jgi:GT2 family glycosyltransferase